MAYLRSRPPALSSARTTLAHHRGAILRPFTRSNRRRRNPTAAARTKAIGGRGSRGWGGPKHRYNSNSGAPG